MSQKSFIRPRENAFFGRLIVPALIVLGLVLAFVLAKSSSSTVSASVKTDRDTIAVQCNDSGKDCFVQLCVDRPRSWLEPNGSAAFSRGTELLEVKFWWTPAQGDSRPFGREYSGVFRFGIGPKGESRDLALVREVRWLDSNGRLVKETEVR